VQASARKKDPVSGESVASYAKRTGLLGVISSRGAEVRRDGVWKRVGMHYLLKNGEIVRPALPAAGNYEPFDLSQLLSSLVKGRRNG
jgi:hypothetical protein